jgi:hypothetical protein
VTPQCACASGATVSSAIAAPRTTARHARSPRSRCRFPDVEDEVLILLPLAEYLRDRGYPVFEASNVAEAKAVLDADTPVDLVFTM